MIAGAIISTNAVAQNLFAQAKLTHEARQISGPSKQRAAVLGMRPVRGACFMQGGGGSSRCE
jgi:hypothetical protein